MKKVLVIFGTRPEAIKLAPVINELKKYPSEFKVVVCVTGQHRQMLDQALNTFAIVPDYNINIMSANQDLFDVTIKTLDGLREILKKEQPDLVLVQGDTTTAFASSMAAFYLKIDVGHVEAGLRTYDKYHPFPEEINRNIVTVLADYHFAPTEWAKSNLLNEGIPSESIWVTGNTGIDALLTVARNQKAETRREYFEDYFKKKWNITFSFKNQSLGLKTHNPKLLLVTGHRRENFGKGFENICLALKEIAEKRHDVKIVYPVHLNPNVQKPVKSILNGKPNIHLTAPLEYEPFVFLMSCSFIILTDSGGIQEEAPSFGKPVLVMRNTTERPEGVKAGGVKLVGTEKNKIINETIKLIENRSIYNKMSKSSNPYGDGKASERIVNILGALFKC